MNFNFSINNKIWKKFVFGALALKRVNVETSYHKVIGRLRFNVTQVDTEPALKTEVLN